MPSHNAPSAGAKVTAGQNAPVTQEAVGAVPSDSLAASSATFTQANDASPAALPHEQLKSSPPEAHTGNKYSGAASAGDTGASDAHPAPTYVNNQYVRDPKGPHGKNVVEDDSIGTDDKARNASYAPIGSKDDPSALAEKKIELGNNAVAGSTDARQKGVSGGKTAFDALGSEKEA